MAEDALRHIPGAGAADSARLPQLNSSFRLRFLQSAKTNTKIKTETDKQYTVTSETNQKETRTNSFGLQKCFQK